MVWRCEMTPQELDDLLSAARSRPAEASSDFMARMLEDAYALQPDPVVQAAPAVAPPGLLARFSRWVFGFGGAATGLATATAAGVWIGFVQPAPVTTIRVALQGAETVEQVDLIPSLDGWLSEG